jgi:hypothetical protein
MKLFQNSTDHTVSNVSPAPGMRSIGTKKQITKAQSLSRAAQQHNGESQTKAQTESTQRRMSEVYAEECDRAINHHGNVTTKQLDLYQSNLHCCASLSAVSEGSGFPRTMRGT